MDGRGVPLSLVVTGANVHDCKRLDEVLTAIVVARKDQLDLSLGIAVGSTLQIALFVAPILVFASVLLGHPMTLSFNPFEVAAIASQSRSAKCPALVIAMSPLSPAPYRCRWSACRYLSSCLL